jgi:hypothetical protein
MGGAANQQLGPAVKDHFPPACVRAGNGMDTQGRFLVDPGSERPQRLVKQPGVIQGQGRSF